MGRFLRNHPLLKSFFLVLVLSSSCQLTHAEVLNIPIKRAVATQAVSALEIVSTIKTLLNGRILSLKKKSTYTNPDCHHVKFLEDKGEFQLITIGCGMQKIAKS